MAVYYLDTSALVKRYIEETGSSFTRDLVSDNLVCTSALSEVETVSALLRRFRECLLAAGEVELILATAAFDLVEYFVLAVDSEALADAVTLLRSSSIALRSLDAIHIATARLAFAGAQRRGLSVGSLVSADRRMLEAASALGLPTLNPEATDASR